MLKKKKRKKLFLLLAAAVLVIAAAVPMLVIHFSKAFTAQEQAVRTDWTFDTGSFIQENAQWEVDIMQANLGEGLYAFQLVPQDIESENFTYYDSSVQQRLSQVVQELKSMPEVTWSATQPLAILNPYGTGSNGLYLYFETDMATQISYSIHVPDSDIPDFTATASDISGEEYTKTHEFQIIGLVPGETNEVTLTITGRWGNTRQIVSFTVEMPQTSSGYSTRLEVTEGYGLDRILSYGSEIITCVSSSKIAKINGLGQVTAIYELEGYDLHHDIGFGAEGEILALAEVPGCETVEDRLLSIDPDSGEVTELINFSSLLSDYYQLTRAVGPNDDFFWQVGERDWIHLNSLVYLEEQDSLILSSRETSSIIKVSGLHTEPAVDWIIGDEAIWQGTAYEEKCLDQEGDFVLQYGQHCVEYYADGETEGVYYFSLYNNNYWSLNSRDLELQVDDSVGVELYDTENKTSQVYIYRIDENNRSYSLESSFDVPYSSIVSNGSLCENSSNWTVNSGMAMVFGEYDEEGTLIRQYKYKCTMQNYRAFKYQMELWFRYE